MRDGREVANYILDYADDHGIEMTNLKLQKIVYFCHAWYMVTRGKPLIRHNFEAWEFGPVLPYLYQIFKAFEHQKITDRAYKLDVMTGQRLLAKIDLDEVEEETLRNIVSFYSRLSASQLVDQSHIYGGPWHRVWHYKGKVNPGMKIKNNDILSFYSSIDRLYSFQ